MRVGLFGGTGFVGSYLVDELLARGHRPRLLVRPGSAARVGRGCETVSGSVEDDEAVRGTVEGCEAVAFNIGILREFPDQGVTFEALQHRAAVRAMEAAGAAGVRRFLLMSANGAKPDGTPYQRTKYRAEEHLRGTDLEWTIFRPSVIFGDPRGRSEFATRLREEVVAPPVPAPLFHPGLLPLNAGRFELQPVHVADVAGVFVRALETPGATRRTYVLCGPKALSWAHIIQVIARASGKRRKLVFPVPALAVKAAAAPLERFEFSPVTRDQITMLLEGNTGDSSEVFREFGIAPTPFDEASLAYLKGA